jgi:putative FmdB family regulatory protein
MPIYEYFCEDCHAKFEKLVRRAEEASELACPSCGQKRLTLQLSVFAARRGGSGEEAAACPDAPYCPNADMCGME